MASTVDWVLCRYNEDVSWVADIVRTIPNLRRVVIYNKGNAMEPSGIEVIRAQTSAAVSVVKLPNIGRESNAYIIHIRHNYDTLADTTIFTQGGFTDKYSMEFIRAWVADIHALVPDTMGMDLAAHETHGQHFAFQDEVVYPGIARSPYTIGEFAQKFLHLDVFPDTASLYGCFKARRDKLHRLSKQDYERLLRETGLGSSTNPEEGFYMERLWLGAFCS